MTANEHPRQGCGSGRGGRLVIDADARSVCGPRRPENQDAFLCDVDSGLFVVADGLGGVAGGAQASKRTVETIRANLAKLSEATDVADSVKAAIAEAHRAVLEDAGAHSDTQDMASTVVLAMVHGARLTVAHAGDSRCYLLRDATLEQLTEDHSRVQLLIKRKLLPPEAVYDHPMRNTLTQVVGGSFPPVPAVTQLDLRCGDRLLLCTDGLWGEVRDPRLTELLSRPGSPKDLCRILTEAALEAGARDNVTVLVVNIAEEHAGEGKEP